jgi:hypothetical protein
VSRVNIQAIFQIVAVLAMFYGVAMLASLFIGIVSMQSANPTFSVSGFSGATKAGVIAAGIVPMVAGFVLYSWAAGLSQKIAQSCGMEG